MAKLQQAADFNQLKTIEDVTRFVTRFCSEVKDQINGNLQFQENMRCNIIECSFPLANRGYPFSHGLGKIPKGYFIVQTQTATTISDSPAQNTDQVIYLGSSNPVPSVKVLVFL